MAALSTALIVGAGIAGGTSLAAAGIGAHAAGKASEQQQESADKSLALQREMYQQQRADTAPWRNTGGEAVQTLGGLMGLGQPKPYNWGPPPGATPNAPYGPGFGILQPGVTPEQAADPNFQYVSPLKGAAGVIQRWEGKPMDAAQTLSTFSPSQQQALGQVGAGAGNVIGNFRAGQGPPTQNASSYVQMRAPTGEVQSVPAEQAAHYEQMGARRVG